MWHPAPEEFAHSQLSLNNFFQGQDGHQEMLRNHSGTGEWVLFQERLELRSNGQERVFCAWEILTGQIAGLESFQSDFDLRRPVSVGAECDEQFFKDALCRSSFHA
jgi:hypothetical protein